MKCLNPAKLHVTYLPGVSQSEPLLPRRYTLTHSDITGELFLSVGAKYDEKRVSHWYTRLMRDEVLAEWEIEKESPSLAVHCHVSGGVVFGSSGMRNGIFRHELPLALEAIRFGDRLFIEAHPELDGAAVRVRFHATQARYDVKEDWGTLKDYS
jgi:Staygreen protein